MEVVFMDKQRKLIFYGAISVDGYIARKDHSLDWLMGTEGEELTHFEAFYETVDTINMGRKTYDQILIHAPDNFPYKGKQCYVFSRSLRGSTEYVEFINTDMFDFTS